MVMVVCFAFNKVFDKAAYVAVEVSKLKGEGRLRFSRKTGANWSFAFLEVRIDKVYSGSNISSHGAWI